MERKRKLPARAARVENPSKKRTPDQTPPAEPPAPSPAPAVEELLPKQISAGKPLPTIDSPQPEDLPSKEYQSIAER